MFWKSSSGDSDVYPVLRTAREGDPWSLVQGESVS